MPNTYMTTTTDAGFIPTWVAERSLGALVGNLQLAVIATRDWDSQLQKYGATINIPIRGALTVQDKSANTDLVPQAATATTVALTLNKQKVVSFLTEDVTRTEVNQDVIAGYTEDAVKAIAEQIEKDGMAAAVTGFTTTTGTSTIDADEALLVNARKLLKDAKVPTGGPLYAFWSTKDIAALLQINKFSAANTRGDGGKVIASGDFGETFGLQNIESQYVQKTGATTQNIAFHPDALTLAMRPLAEPPQGLNVRSSVVAGVPGMPTQGLGIRIVTGYDLRGQGVFVTVDALYGWAAPRVAFGVVANT